MSQEPHLDEGDPLNEKSNLNVPRPDYCEWHLVKGFDMVRTIEESHLEYVWKVKLAVDIAGSILIIFVNDMDDPPEREMRVNLLSLLLYGSEHRLR